MRKCSEPKLEVIGSTLKITLKEPCVTVHYVWGSADELQPGALGTTLWIDESLIPIDISTPATRFLSLLLSKKGMMPTTMEVAFSVERLQPPHLIQDKHGHIEIWLAPPPDALVPLDPYWFGDGDADVDAFDTASVRTADTVSLGS